MNIVNICHSELHVCYYMNNCLCNSFYIRLGLNWSRAKFKYCVANRENLKKKNVNSIIIIIKKKRNRWGTEATRISLLRRNMLFTLALRQRRKNNDLETQGRFNWYHRFRFEIMVLNILINILIISYTRSNMNLIYSYYKICLLF